MKKRPYARAMIQPVFPIFDCRFSCCGQECPRSALRSLSAFQLNRFPSNFDRFGLIFTFLIFSDANDKRRFPTTDGPDFRPRCNCSLSVPGRPSTNLIPSRI